MSSTDLLSPRSLRTWSLQQAAKRIGSGRCRQESHQSWALQNLSSPLEHSSAIVQHAKCRLANIQSLTVIEVRKKSVHWFILQLKLVHRKPCLWRGKPRGEGIVGQSSHTKLKVVSVAKSVSAVRCDPLEPE